MDIARGCIMPTASCRLPVQYQVAASHRKLQACEEMGKQGRARFSSTTRVIPKA
jgi:hypothetical protein